MLTILKMDEFLTRLLRPSRKIDEVLQFMRH